MAHIQHRTSETSGNCTGIRHGQAHVLARVFIEPSTLHMPGCKCKAGLKAHGPIRGFIIAYTAWVEAFKTQYCSVQRLHPPLTVFVVCFQASLCAIACKPLPLTRLAEVSFT